MKYKFLISTILIELYLDDVVYEVLLVVGVESLFYETFM